MMKLKKEITIVGGGIVGILLALALARLSHDILLIEQKSILKNDNRSIVLSYSTVSVINALGIWKYIKKHVTYIEHIHVSEKKAYSHFELNKDDENLPFLGVVIKIHCLLTTLMNQLKKLQKIETLFGYSVKKVKQESKICYGLTIINQSNKMIDIESKLIIAADGTNSSIKKALAIPSKSYDYEQFACVFDLELKRGHQGCAYERFIDDGSIIAMLPLIGKNASCIWVLPSQRLNFIARQSKIKILELLQKTFGYRLGKFYRMQHQTQFFPLALVQSKILYQGNVLLFGNAAHCLHPVLAQGLNLSIRDVAVLYDLIAEQPSGNLLAHNIYLKYKEIRYSDHQRTAMITHSLVNFFAKKAILYKSLRQLGINILQHSSLAKKSLSHLMLGKLSYGSTLMQQPVNFK